MRRVKARVGGAGEASFVLPAGESRPQNESQSHIYLNLSIVNADTSDSVSSAPVQCVFSESRSTPILQDASEYDLSVIRFSATGTGRLLPLFIPVIQAGQPDVNLTIYSVTIINTAPAVPIHAQVYLSYIANNGAAPVPRSSSPQDLSTSYYYLRTYTTFCNMFNVALNTAHLNATTTFLPTPTMGLTYSNTSGLFSLELPALCYPVYDPATGIVSPPSLFLSFNAPLTNLLANFNFYQQPIVINGANFTVVPPNVLALATPTGPVFSQDFLSTDDVWSPIDGFVFTSTFIPLLPEQGTAPTVVGSTDAGQFQGVGAGFTNIITDIVIDTSKGAQDNISSLLYNPSGEYRIASMTTHQAVQQVDVTLWWRYRLTGTLYPLYMANLSSVNLKIMFRRKDWGTK